MHSDQQLSMAEKLELIEKILIRQRERWARMKFFHNSPLIKMGVRHFFMQNEINLMRSYKQRLEDLKQSIYS